MDLLKRELERKKKALEEAKKINSSKRRLEEENDNDTTSTTTTKRSRYVKAGELRRWMEQVEEEQGHRGDNVDESRKNESDEQALKATTTTTTTAGSSNNNNSHDTTDSEEAAANQNDAPPNQSTSIHRKTNASSNSNHQPPESQKQKQNHHEQQTTKTVQQIMAELRQMNLPITLFGETVEAKTLRYQTALQQQMVHQLDATEADEFRLGLGHGIRNPFLEKDDDDNDNDDNVANNNVVSNPKTSSHLKSDDPNNENSDKEDNNNNNSSDDDPHKRIYRHFKGLLKQWEADLNDRPDDVKRSLAGRNERKTVKQCKDYIRPLFQLCKRRQLDENLLQKLYQMVLYCEEGEFVKAHDAYLDVAIGRAAWPIGVTMVGIHARSGRAKIESSNVAHVMNSELQRKYLTSVKRLLSYEQSKRTDVDPSKKVLH